MNYSNNLKLVSLLFAGLLLTGCGGDSSSNGGSTPTPSPPSPATYGSITATASPLSISQSSNEKGLIQGGAESQVSSTLSFNYDGGLPLGTITVSVKNSDNNSSSSSTCQITKQGCQITFIPGTSYTPGDALSVTSSAKSNGTQINVKPANLSIPISPSFGQQTWTNSQLALKCDNQIHTVFGNGGSQSGGIPNLKYFGLNEGNGTCTVGILYTQPSITKKPKFISANDQMIMTYTIKNNQFTKLIFQPKKSTYEYTNMGTRLTVDIEWENLGLIVTEKK